MACVSLRLAAALPLLFFGMPAAETLPEPSRTPATPTAEQQALVREGIRLHDAGDYDGAIAKYKEVLYESPDVVNALYELSFTYFTKGDYETALTYTRRGLQYRSDLLPGFYINLGNCLDELGKRDEAIEVYRTAVQRSPGSALLHYNLGLTLVRSGNYAAARPDIEQSVTLDPEHSSSHLLLATIYERLGYRVPALLALSRFLLLEPASGRSKAALETVHQLMNSGVSTRSGDKGVTITLGQSQDSLKDEGDFGTAEIAMSLAVAASQLPKAREQSTPFQLFAANYAILGETLSSVKAGGFAAAYYAPFFAEMNKRGFNEAFVFRAFRVVELDGSAKWAAKNDSKLRDFDAWLTAYRWPAPK